jgi:murein DD-endopeptidase MepM/ murein hydrolase activator NlpD
MKRNIEVALAVATVVIGVCAIIFIRPTANAGTPQTADATAPNPYDATQVKLPLFSHPPVPGPVVSEFGAPRPQRYEKGTHSGVDFDAKVGDPVIALAGGAALNTAGRGGACVRVMHEALPGISFTIYCHIDSEIPNGTVRAGQRIGTIAKPGAASIKQHLHLQIIDDKGQSINPCQPSIMLCPKSVKR